jgi:anti-sigma factor RsiW
MSEDRFDLLNDYLDGALPAEARAELERRLETDAELAAELRELRGLVAAAAELPREMTPPRDLWPDIERRLSPARIVRLRFPRPAVLWRAGALAAAAALVIFVLTSNRDGKQDPESAQMAAAGETAPEAGVPDGAAPEDVSPEARLDLEYAAASREVLERLERGEQLDPETVDLIRRNLAIIDEAVREIREAIDASPDDARLHRQLNTEVRRRGEVLRQAADLGSSI